MSLESKTLDGSEKKVERKPWRELKQSELDERVRSISDSELIDTSTTSYDPVINLALGQIQFELYGAKSKGHSSMLYGNLYRGTDMLSYDIGKEIKILGEASLLLFKHPNPEVREEVLREVVYYKFSHSKKMNLKIQTWVPNSLSNIAKRINIIWSQTLTTLITRSPL